MISDELTEAINEQIGHEFESEAYYLAMAAYLNKENWNGFAHFMKLQAEEEREHGMKFYEFLDDVGQQVIIPGIEKPPSEFESIEDVFETALEQEQKITHHIHELLRMARENGDLQAETILEWFVDEQVEEENLMGDLLERVRRAGDDTAALLILDEDLSERTLEE